MSTEIIGSYRIVETLGQGGMGVVYRARHSISERAVALKTVRLPTSRWLDSMRREIQALTRVHHPGVVRIVDHGVHQGRPWYAMDLLEGETLRHFGRRLWSPCLPYHVLSTPVGLTEPVTPQDGFSSLDDDPDGMRDGVPTAVVPVRTTPGAVKAAAGDLGTVVRVIRRVCATLAYLHGEGFINCDLKPENVMLVDGEPVIIDFGLTARHPAGSGRERLESLGGITGTVPYMSPEQIRGEFVDARSDLYAVGCMLYELVVGTPPFCGPPRSVSLQHLSALPVPPSALVSEVPSELERLILRLLEKEPSERIGYADEVAAELAKLGSDGRLAAYPPSRSYLYRPRFVGRDALMSNLDAKRHQAIEGCGSMILLGGESGSGKTRLAMELTRTSRHDMRVITSETSALAAEGDSSGTPSPLSAIRPLLQAIADECQAGGPEVTRRLLGGRQSVLSGYEPLLAQVPADGPSSAPLPLPPDASRKRLFDALQEALAALARDRPLLWVIDDLSWVDEMSLAFLRSLSTEYLHSSAVLIVCTYRSEDPGNGIHALAGAAHVSHLHLDRLESGPIASMIGDMLALSEPADELVEFVTQEAEGNPFFVAEYLRAAVAEHLLYRDNAKRWRTRAHPSDASAPPLLLSLPRSLRDLLNRRLHSLSPPGQLLSLAAAVLGREMDVELLREVSGQPDATFGAAVDELVRRQVLEQPKLGSLRFVHDKIRETAYAQAAAGRLRELHARAGTALERRGARSDLASLWLAMGHHFALAHAKRPALRYLKLAADHARASFAHAEAIRLYQRALEQARELRSEAQEVCDEQLLVSLLDLIEALADIFAIVGPRSEARDRYEEALAEAPEHHVVRRSRLKRKLGKTWEAEHQYDDALRFYAAAHAGLVDLTSDDQRDEWIQVNIERVWVYYWLGRAPEMRETMDALRPMIDAHGTATQRARFFQALLMHSLRHNRYVADEETLGYARSALAACTAAATVDLPMASFLYGLALLFHDSLVAADEQLKEALTLARHVGDGAQQARCLTYLALTARRREKTASVRSYAEQALAAAVKSGMRDYVAAANAAFAWLALREGDLAEAEKRAHEALQLWGEIALAFPLKWTAVLPLLALRDRASPMDEAVAHIEAMLHESQQRLPQAATEHLRLVLQHHASHDQAGAQNALDRAVVLLDQANFR